MIPTPEQIEIWRGRDYSWSQHSSFKWDPRQWFDKYVLGLEEEPTPELIFGKAFADALEAGKPMAPMTLLSVVEQPFKVPFDGFTLIGYADTFCGETKRKIGEFKTGVKPWDQARVDGHGQLTLYAFMNYLANGVRPEDVEMYLEWVPTKKVPRDNGDFSGHDYHIAFRDEEPLPIRFDTTRSMTDALMLGGEIQATRKMMEQYIESRV